MKNKKAISTLIKIADMLDQQNKAKLAEEVDKVINVLAVRKKAPLKHLDESVKKDLIKFVNKVEKNLKESVDSLEELFRRLRYFDINDVADETGLSKAIKNIKTTHDCVDSASKKIYELSYGHRPKKDEMEQMLDDFDTEKHDAASFFESQNKSDKSTEEVNGEIPETFWHEE